MYAIRKMSAVLIGGHIFFNIQNISRYFSIKRSIDLIKINTSFMSVNINNIFKILQNSTIVYVTKII